MKFRERPYLKWLGLSQDDPDHFALLRIDSGESDPETIKKAAKDALKRIGKEPSDPGDLADWKQVRRRIKTAYQCLKQETTRAAYLDQLLVRAELEINLTDEEDSQETSTALDTVTDELRAEMLDKDQSLDTAQDEIPVAVPMAEVIEDGPRENQQPAPVAPATPKIQAPVAKMPAQVVHAENPLRRKRKSAWPLLILLTLLAGAGGFAVWQFVIKPQLDEAAHANTSNGSQLENTDPPQPENDRTKIAKRNLTPEPAKKKPAPERQPSTKQPDASDRKKNRTDPGADRKEREWGSAFGINFKDANYDQASTEQDRFALYHHLEEALYAADRRKWHSMVAHLKAVRGLNLQPQTRPVWATQARVSERLKKYWEAAIEQAKKLPAMTELTINDQLVVVTESKKDQLVFRLNGQRIALDYRHLPELLVLAILDNHTNYSDDEKQEARAVVYSLAARLNPKHRQQAEAEIAKTPEEMQHELRPFLSHDLKGIYRPSNGQRLPQTSLRNMKQTRKQLQRRYSELKPPTTPGVGGYREAAMDCRNLALTATTDAQADTFLFVAIEHCRKAHHPLLLNELMNIKRRRAEHGAAAPAPLRNYKIIMEDRLARLNSRDVFWLLLELHDEFVRKNRPDKAQECVETMRSLAQKKKLQNELDLISRRFDAQESANLAALSF